MKLLYPLFHALDRIRPAQKAHAHCDIPCGIYDPHTAQMAAHTVVRMNQLIGELKITPEMNPDDRKEAIHKLARFTHAKEEHAELVKKEVRILWGDYFKPEHVKAYPELHELVWKVMKTGSKARQEVSMEAAEELLELTNKIAEIFWKTKDMNSVRHKAPYPTGKESVYPAGKK